MEKKVGIEEAGEEDNFGIGEDAWKYYGQPRKKTIDSMNHWTYELRVPTQDTSNQAQIIQLWIHY